MTQDSSTAKPDPALDEDDSASRIYLARQPIYDRNKDIFGYELLFRHCGNDTLARLDDGASAATSKVMLNTMMELDLRRLVEDKLAFFNLDETFLLAGTDLPMSSEQIGIEVLEDVPITDATVAALAQLCMLGYTIALDDFSWRDDIERFLELANLVKIDVQKHDVHSQIAMIKQLRDLPVELVAKSVETPADFEQSKRLGFQYFQGFFLCRPTTVSAKRLPESRINVMRLVQRLQNPDVSISELEQIIRTDVGLHFRLLRTVNSAYYGLAVKIKSIEHAILYLGIPAVRSWARLQVMAGVEDRPSELMRLALIRARMCELMTSTLPKATQETAFTIGLFSMLDALLDLPMEDVVSQLPLDDELVIALSQHEGSYGRLLKTVISYERGDWAGVDDSLFNSDRLLDSYLEAVNWANQQYKALTA